MVKWKQTNQKLKEVEPMDPQTEVLEEPTQTEQVPIDYDEVIKVIARDLIKACTDTSVGYDKKLSVVMQDVANKCNDITE